MYSQILTPQWFKDDTGEGTEILSDAGIIKLKIKCINDGNLVIKLQVYFIKVYIIKNNYQFTLSILIFY